MWARRAATLVLAGLALSGCGASNLPAPVPASVTPARGFTANATPITINGDGFSVRTVQPSSGGAPTVDETFQAWMGDQPLQNVRRVDEQTLAATVPAGLAPGLKTLRVQGPFGTSGELANAFTVEGTALASISVGITAAPATANVGQSITVTLTVTNTGTTKASARSALRSARTPPPSPRWRREHPAPSPGSTRPPEPGASPSRARPAPSTASPAPS
jgi:hypothetical protein